VLQSLLNSVAALSPADGHVLVVGDLWISHEDQPPADANPLGHCSAGLLAIALADQGHDVTLVGFVGDDELADRIEGELAKAGVSADLLHLKQWTTFTDADLTLAAAQPLPGREDARRQRRHQDERALPIDGMSEYQAHLQNRAERYLINAGALVLVDHDLGSIAEPRALAFVANGLGRPSLAVLGCAELADRYAEAGCRVDIALDDVSAGVAQALSTLQSFGVAPPSTNPMGDGA